MNALNLMVVDDEPRYKTSGGLQLVSEANAILGVWRRHARRWAVIGTAAVATSAAVAANPATAANQAVVATSQGYTAPAPKPAALHGSILLGTVVHDLPADCRDTPAGGIDYQYCGGSFYWAVFQGNDLVYVTAQP